jgi:hypothetical protein
MNRNDGVSNSVETWSGAKVTMFIAVFINLTKVRFAQVQKRNIYFAQTYTKLGLKLGYKAGFLSLVRV